MLKYQSDWNFKHFVEVGTFFPSTQKCFKCGKKHHMELKDRIFECECGWKVDRDFNSSLNILEEGLNTLGHSGINVCGDDKVHDFVLQNQVFVDEAEKRILA